MPTYIPELSESARRWLRFGALLVVLALLCWIAYRLRAVFTPLVIGLALAYILNPVVTWFEQTQKIQRLSTVVVAFALLGALVLGGGLYLGSKTVVQIQQFSLKIPAYRQTAERWVNDYRLRSVARDETDAATQPAEADAVATPTSAPALADDWWESFTPLAAKHGAAIASSVVNYLLDFASSIVNWATLLVLIPMYTFFFLWRFNDIVRVCRDHLPAAYRDGIIHAVRTIDQSVSNFFRGRLIVCVIVGVLTGIGWSFTGVGPSLPLGVLAGTLNIVPFMSLCALPPALLFAYLGAAEAGSPWALPVVLTMAVYMVVQALESFLLSPAIEGRSSGLHPLVIVVALLIGAQLAGLLGMLLAIPVAGTLRTFAAELVLPEIRRLAANPVQEPAESGTDDATGPHDRS